MFKKMIKTLISLVMITVLAIECLAIPLFALETQAEETSEGDTATSEITSDMVVKSSITAYRINSAYHGKEVTTDLKPEDIIDFKVVNNGGIKLDGHGQYTFSNYATISISLKLTNASMKIKDQNANIIKDIDYKYWAGHVGDTDIDFLNYNDLKSRIGYGVILTSNEHANGKREVFEEIYIRGHEDRVNELCITQDGNYHFVILMSITENNKKKEIVIEYEVPIRTNAYIMDETGSYHVKNAGAYHQGILIDALGRPGVEIFVNNQPVKDGHIIRGDGEYNIKIIGNGYLCENFNFDIFSRDDEHAYIYLSNSRRQIDDISYECENEFKVTWYSYQDATMTYWKNQNPDVVYTYQKGTPITEPGFYIFTLNVKHYENEKKTFLVHLVSDDNPEINHNTLKGNRFNNFKTKWYEVYDDINDAYYCFDMYEYREAYDAAMTIENSRVTDYGHYFKYKGETYAEKFELTAQMNEYAKANVKVMYYDPAATAVEKHFSNKAFDSTIYLNPDFQFVRTSPAETDSIVFTDEQGKTFHIDFFKKISSYSLPDGKYTVTEKDRYSNTTTYECIVDGTAPKFNLLLDGVSAFYAPGAFYVCSYFSITDLMDEYDEYAVLSINNDYYYKSESNEVVYTNPGTYAVRAYDRNNNIINLTVQITDNKQYTLTHFENKIDFRVKDGHRITQMFINGEESLEGLSMGYLEFLPGDKDMVWIVYTENLQTGRTDCAYVKLNAKTPTVNNSPRPPLPEWSAEETENGFFIEYAIYLLVLILVILAGVVFFILNMVWRFKNEQTDENIDNVD